MLFALIISLILLIPTDARLNRKIDSDSPDYEDFYEKLDAEYIQEIYKTTPTQAIFRPVTSDPYNEVPPGPVSSQPLSSESDVEKVESDADAAVRLNCDNPWYWNTFKCVWLDFRNKKQEVRFQRNAKVAGILFGVFCFLGLVPICWVCVIAIYLRSKVAKYSKMMDHYLTEYAPGSIILPNGKVKYYDSTPEEMEAFEDLIHTISSVV